jgi:hypothetical protein
MGNELNERAETRWVLAFDASCGTCREISAVVAGACRERLEVLSLAHPDVEVWRHDVFGHDGPWAPTLIKAGPDGVRAWTGAALATHLALRLGPRALTRVLGALGELDRGGAAAARGLSRARFLRIAAGAGIAAGLVFAGRAPAFAAVKAPAERWVAANRDRLPRTYDGISAQPVAYRRAIWAELPAPDRSTLWLAHLDRYRADHPDLTADQREVLDRAGVLAADPAIFATVPSAAARLRMEELQPAALRAFGTDEGRLAFATLGPVGPATAEPAVTVPACTCSVESPFCVCEGRCTVCAKQGGWGLCAVTTSGCGNFWSYPCDGRCTSDGPCGAC